MSKEKVVPIGINFKKEVVVMPADDYEMPELKIVLSEKENYCSHEQVQVWQYHRVVKCSNCGANLDPFDFILSCGKQERYALSSLQYIRWEIKQSYAERDKLRKEVINLKAQKRRL